MSPDKVGKNIDSLEDAFESIVLAYDEALAAGTDPSPLDTATVPPELAERVRSARYCLSQLEQARRRREWPTDSESSWSVSVSSAAMDSEAEAPFPFAQGRVGRFELERELGRGGHGVVFLARDPALNRLVALKVPRPEVLLTADLSRRFLREAYAAAALKHPNLVAVHEVGEDGPLHYIATEYCDGPTLAQWAQRQDAVPIRDAVRIVAALADGVAEAHRQEILHRDIKPGNVLLEPIADSSHGQLDFTPKLTDFGLAKLSEFDGDATRTGVLLGTPSYMAPEQAAGRIQDIKQTTDVYALGAVLYELLTGQRLPRRLGRRHATAGRRQRTG